MCNKVAIIEKGRLLSCGDHRAILDGNGDKRALRLEVLDGDDIAALVLEETPGVLEVNRSGREFRIESTLDQADAADLLSRLVRAGVKVISFEQHKGTLEDLFLKITTGEL
jgi:ABC-type multidrug transport system ATPase subunit